MSGTAAGRHEIENSSSRKQIEQRAISKAHVQRIRIAKIAGQEGHSTSMIVVFSFLIGLFAGLRSLMAPATTSWAVYLGWLRLEGPLSLIGSLPSVAIFTLLAIVELVADKLPKTPNRTSPPGLIARIVMGGLTGACVASGGGQGIFVGALLGAIGGVAGCFLGYWTRTGIVQALGTRDLVVALLEDIVAVAGCLWIVSRF